MSFVGDEDILYKLMSPGENIHNNFKDLIIKYSLKELNFKNSQVESLIKASLNGELHKVRTIATNIYNKLRG